MFQHILVPVDGASSTRQAIVKAAGIARAFKSAVTVIYVIDPYAFTGVGADFSYGQAEYLSAASAEAQQAITAVTQVFLDHGVAVTSSVVEGHAIYRGILQTADSVGADLLVMASHGRRGLDKLVLGSVTARVLAHARIPVLVVRD